MYPSRDCLEYGTGVLRRLQKVLRYLSRCLMLFCPFPYGVEIPAFVPGIKIHIGRRLLWIPPDLSEHTDVHGAHELLAENV